MRLYVVVQAALSTGAKLAQVLHTGVALSLEHPDVFERWGNERIVVLHDEDLPSIAERLEAAGHRLARWHEPDAPHHGALTAIAVEGAARPDLSTLALER